MGVNIYHSLVLAFLVKGTDVLISKEKSGHTERYMWQQNL